MLIAPDISIDDRWLHFDFIRSSGPGGQNVNKVATAVQLRFDLAHADMPEDVRLRLRSLSGRRVNLSGELIIDARRHRTQDANRQDALDRLADLIRLARQRPKARRATRPTQGSRTRRLETKRRRSQNKQLRTRPADE